MWFDALAVIVSVAAGAIAAVTGFGIGSLLTPLLALQVDTRLAVAAVSVPHVVGTALRFWYLRSRIDRRVFWNFGLTSAAGGLLGALLYGWASNRWLNVVFGILLLFAAASEVTGLARRMRFHGSVAWIARAVLGMLGPSWPIKAASDPHAPRIRNCRSNVVATATAVGSSRRGEDACSLLTHLRLGAMWCRSHCDRRRDRWTSSAHALWIRFVFRRGLALILALLGARFDECLR